ncbi:hypothetical protein PEDI_55770 [Persicobacter diffluens]|uniref:Uncharacterized protein n=1 Tax=Persicobacter diffluens TaxID=981 RepID=A0AAN4W5N5_9BACT|nr:hypothetical protein PEDI_55770 [Persicobacter diffluens]
MIFPIPVLRADVFIFNYTGADRSVSIYREVNFF